MASDTALIDAYRHGNARALSDLMDRHKRSLMGLFGRRVGEDAEELYQELWNKVVRSLDRYRDDGRFRAFLFAAARRLIIDHYRRRAARPHLVGCDEPPELAIEPVDAVAYNELVDAVEAALAGMNPATAEVMRLRLYRQLTFAEIAQMQGAPLNTVLSCMHRGLKKLRRELDARGLRGT